MRGYNGFPQGVRAVKRGLGGKARALSPHTGSATCAQLLVTKLHPASSHFCTKGQRCSVGRRLSYGWP